MLPIGREGALHTVKMYHTICASSLMSPLTIHLPHLLSPCPLSSSLLTTERTSTAATCAAARSVRSYHVTSPVQWASSRTSWAVWFVSAEVSHHTQQTQLWFLDLFVCWCVYLFVCLFVVSFPLFSPQDRVDDANIMCQIFMSLCIHEENASIQMRPTARSACWLIWMTWLKC